MLTKYITSPTEILENIDWMPLDFAEPLLMRTTTCTKRACRLRYYSQVGVAYIIQQTISSLAVSITGLPRAHSNGVAYQDVKEPRYIIAKKKKKNAMSVFMLNVLNYITVSRPVCKMYLLR